jgi:hypothetical protein
MKHYITKYTDTQTNKTYVVAWLQVNLFGNCYCFSERTKEIK